MILCPSKSLRDFPAKTTELVRPVLEALSSHNLFVLSGAGLAVPIIAPMNKLAWQSRGAPNDAQKARMPPVWRRWEQAAETLDMAHEAEDFQAVGMKCRECLLELVRSLSRPEMVPSGEDPPQGSNFSAWSGLISNNVAAGTSADRIRGHLKSSVKSTWELASWLTHATGAGHHDAEFVLDATHNVIAIFGQAVIRRESGMPKRSPRCSSYHLDVGFNPELSRPYVTECEECGWQSPVAAK